MCTPLAIATDPLILLVSLCPRDACASVDVLNLFDNLNCWLDLYIASTPLSTMSTSYCHSLHLPISLLLYHWTVLTCIFDLYYCIVLCICIYPSVYSEYRFISLLLTHMSACDCISLVGRTIYFVLILCIITCILPLTLTFILANSSASTIVGGRRPCPHPYNLF